MEPAASFFRSLADFGIGDFQSGFPIFFFGAQQPARLQDFRVIQVFDRNVFQFQTRVGGTTQPQPADGGIQVVDIGWFNSQSLCRLHAA